MTIVDSILPAAVHLAGPFAGDVLRPAIERAGGDLRSFRCVGLQYRPGSDLVAQFRVEVTWQGGEPVSETLVAATTVTGAPAGTVPVLAETATGDLSVGVWRWPFDPALPALDAAVRRRGLHGLLREAELLDDSIPIDLEVVAYRPTERAVIRVRNGERSCYVKVVRPERTSLMIRRISVLESNGLPVPQVLAADLARGWIALTEVAGPTLRELIKSDAPTWVEPSNFRALVRNLGATDATGLPGVRSRILDAPIHASILASVLPEERLRLDGLSAMMREALSSREERPRHLIHGDLHEGQIVVDDGRITGLLDFDEVGLGDPVDDVAVPLAHLRYRASVNATNAARIEELADGLESSFAVDHTRSEIAIGTAAALIGIATGPFRLQRDGWRTATSRVLDLVERALP